MTNKKLKKIVNKIDSLCAYLSTEGYAYKAFKIRKILEEMN